LKYVNVMLLMFGAVWTNASSRAESSWGGSLVFTSDYLVRGISRSNDQAAIQLDLHFSADSGLLAGLFASTAQIATDQPRDVELDAFLGYAWNSGGDWRGQVRETYYTYPWNQQGSAYNYTEFDADVVYRDAIEIVGVYSPDTPRYLMNRGFVDVTSSAVEVNFQHQLYDKLSGIAGAGYSYLGGASGAGYEYWSAGAMYDFGHVTLVVSYVGVSGGAKSLFYQQNGTARADASVICRF
jgi:uncharacterized protein (TIGR02001 family)